MGNYRIVGLDAGAVKGPEQHCQYVHAGVKGGDLHRECDSGVQILTGVSEQSEYADQGFRQRD